MGIGARLLGTFALASIVLVPTSPITAQVSSEPSGAEVRIAARWTGDGILEVGLQQLSEPGWENLIPRSRIAIAGGWRFSSEIGVATTGQVRISARTHRGSHAELALQQQTPEGTWGWQILPTNRYLPTGGTNWAISSPMTIHAFESLPPPTEIVTLLLPQDLGDDSEPTRPQGASEDQAQTAAQSPGSDQQPYPIRYLVDLTSPRHDRSLDGRGNNLRHPSWGAADTTLLRLARASYRDGVSTPTTSRPNPRVISNRVFSQRLSVPNSRFASDLTWQWGQFIDHDISHSLDNPDESFSVQVPIGDTHFDPDRSGLKVIHVNRSVSDPETGTGPLNPRRQKNALTAFIDGSQVYGSDDARARSLRTMDGTGKLKTSLNGRFLTYNDQGLENDGGSDRSDLFLAGDVRSNEQIGLIAMHTLFMREHNRLAELIASQNPGIGGEAIYQTARKIVGAHIQAITFNEFLPLLLGPDAIGPYPGYNPEVNPTIASEFSAAAFRVGHTMVSPSLLVIGADGETEKVSLASAFFNPGMVTEHGISAILRGLASQQAQQVDSKVIDEARNLLLRGPGGPTFDLVTLNIQRGRDHGLGDYNTVRAAFGLPKVKTLADISSDTSVQRELESAYQNGHDMDLWPAALAEDHVPGALVGETLRAIISDQFRRLRDGDRFWFENDPYFVANPQILEEIRTTTLADIIRRNTYLEDEIQDNAFIVRES